jgi:hypothetical protein
MKNGLRMKISIDTFAMGEVRGETIYNIRTCCFHPSIVRISKEKI